MTEPTELETLRRLARQLLRLSGWSWHGPDGKPRIAVDADELNRLKAMAAGWEKAKSVTSVPLIEVLARLEDGEV